MKLSVSINYNNTTWTWRTVSASLSVLMLSYLLHDTHSFAFPAASTSVLQSQSSEALSSSSSSSMVRLLQHQRQRTSLRSTSTTRTSSDDMQTGVDADTITVGDMPLDFTNGQQPTQTKQNRQSSMMDKAVTSSKSARLPQPVKMVVNEQAEYEMNLGKAMDTLRKDYPKILTKDLDYDIYDQDLVVVDPSGVTLHGLSNYKASFKFLHTVVNFFYCEEASGVTFRMVYDWARSSVRISWNAVLVPRAIYGGVRNKLYVDGISLYELNRTSGKISKHSIERLVVNDAHVRASQGVLHGLATEIINPRNGGEIPVLGVAGGSELKIDLNEFSKLSNEDERNSFVGSLALMSESSSSASSSNEAFEKKNLARKKFGLPPISKKEFDKLEAETRRQSASAKEAQQQLSAQMIEEKRKKDSNPFAKMFDKALKNGCEENWDCERPQVCCDFIVKKVCCSSGMKVNNYAPRLAEVRVTDGYPEGDVYDDRYPRRY